MLAKFAGLPPNSVRGEEVERSKMYDYNIIVPVLCLAVAN